MYKYVHISSVSQSVAMVSGEVVTSVSVCQATTTPGGTMDHSRAGRLNRLPTRSMRMDLIALKQKVSDS